MTITENQISKIGENAIDQIGEIVDRSWTESEECYLHIAIAQWCRQMGIEVKNE